MENSKTLRTRVLALALTLLMVIGVLPMSVFAISPAAGSVPTDKPLDTGTKFVAPTADEIREKFGADSILYYNDFNSYTGSAGIDTGKVGGGTYQSAATSSVADGNGGYAVSIGSQTGADNNFWPAKSWATNEHLGGNSFVFAADVKYEGTINYSTYLFYFSPRGTNQVWATPVVIDTDGSIYLGHNGTSVFAQWNEAQYYGTALGADKKVGGKIGQLSTDKFTNIAVVLNVPKNTFKVIIDGIDVSGDKTLFTQAQLDTIAGSPYVNGWAPSQVFTLHAARKTITPCFVMDNLMAYMGDDYLFKTVWGNTVYPEFVRPTADDIKNRFGDKSIVTNLNFNNYEVGTTATGNPFFNGSVNVLDDGNGGAAVQLTGWKGGYMHIGPSWSHVAGNAGKSFVIAMDLKAPESMSNPICLLPIQDKKTQGIAPLFLDTDGTVYLGYVDGHIYSNGNPATAVQATYLQADQKAGGAVAKLRKDKFTNIAVVIDVANNTFKVIVDGVNKTGNLNLFSDAQLEAINASYTGGYAVSDIRPFSERGSTSLTNYIVVDNIMFYYGNDYFEVDPQVGMYTGGKIYNDEEYVVNNYKTDSKYWAPVYKAFANGSSSIDYENNLYEGAAKSAWKGTKPSVTNDELKFTGTHAIALFDAYSTANKHLSNIYKKGLAGLDVAFSTEVKFLDGTKNGQRNFSIYTPAVTTAHNFLRVVAEDGAYKLYAVASQGDKELKFVCDITPDTYYKIDVLFDFGGLSNTYYVFVNGVYACKNELLTEARAESIIAKEEGAGGEMPFGVTLGGFQTNGTIKADAKSLDLYFYDDNADGDVTDSSRDVYSLGDICGYYPMDGKIYYYENSELVANKVSADGILNIDENGAVKFGDTFIKSMTDIYDFVDMELIPKDGIYSGIYTGDLVAGKTDGALYFYDADKKLVKNADVDLKDAGVEVDSDVVGYAFGANGKATGALNGLKIFDGVAHVYVDGVRQTGMLEIDGENYFADAEGNLVTGVMVYENVALYFDEETYAASLYTGFAEIGGKGYFYVDGVLQTEESVDTFGTTNPYYYDGYYYYIAPGSGSELYKGEGVVGIDNVPYVFEGYKAVKLVNAVYNGQYYDEVGNIVKEEFFQGADGTWYHADEDGYLLTGIANIPALDRFYIFANDTFAGAVMNGVYNYDFDGDEIATNRLFVDGILQLENVNVGDFWYAMDENGDLYENEYDSKPNVFNGKWFVKGGENNYELVLANGILVVSDKAPADEANEHKMFVDGDINYGDENDEIANGDSFYKYDANGSLYNDYVDGVLCSDGKTYDFDGYTPVLRDNYFLSPDGLYWIDGYKAETRIHFVPTEDGLVEMYLVDGKPSAGEIPTEDGTVHVFGEDGLRVAVDGDEDVEDKAPHSIVVIYQFKDGDTVTRLSKKEFYRFWNTAYTLTPGYYQCYGYTITIDGEEVSAAEGEVLKAAIAASDRNDHVIVVTYDKAVENHVALVLDENETVLGNCMTAAKYVYKCAACDRHGKVVVEGEIDPNRHDLTTATTGSTHTEMGKKVTTCANGCDYSITEYLPLTPHVWTEVAGSRVAPTCGADGSVKFSCTCGAERIDILFATGIHSYVAVGTNLDATCGTKGEVYYKCTVCEDEYTAYTPCTGGHQHDPEGEYTVMTDANEMLDTYLYDCKVCGTKNIIAIMADPNANPDPDDPDEPDDPIIPSPVPSPVPQPQE